MSLRPEIKDRARGDMVRQYRWYCRHAGNEVADQFLAAVDSALVQLSSQPQLGVRCNFKEAVFRNFRFFPLERPFASFLIFYRSDPAKLEVMRVLHSARDIPRRLREESPAYIPISSNPIGSAVLLNGTEMES